MEFLKRSKIQFALSSLKGHLYLLVIYIITLIYAAATLQLFYLIIPFLILIFLFFYERKMFYLSIIILILIIPRLIIRNITFNTLEYGECSAYAKVTSVDIKEDYEKVYLKINGYTYIYNNSKISLSSGDYVYLEGITSKASSSHFEGSFNYYNYLKFNNIAGIIKINNIEVIKHSFNINIIHEKLARYIKNNYSSPSNSLLSALTIGDKGFMDDELNDTISTLGIGHLFVISGLHMQLIGSLIYLILKRIKIKEEIKNYIVLAIYIIYYIITSFMVSILRVMMGMLISKILHKIFTSFSSLEKLFINGIIVLIINPYYLFSYSFLLSYAVVLVINLEQKYFKKEKGIKTYIYNSLLISIGSIFISIPIVSNITGTINILQMIYNLFYIPFVSYVLMPFSFLSLFLPFLKDIYSYVVNIFITVSNKLASISFLEFTLPKINIIISGIYYILFFGLFLKFKPLIKYLLLGTLLSMIVLISNNQIFNLNKTVYFMDLPSGDATLFVDRVNKLNVLIDTGDDDETLYDYLRIKGIKRLDLIIITHSDTDHIGGLSKLINKLKIKAIGIGKYDTSGIDYINKIKKKKTKLYILDCDDSLSYKSMNIKVISPISDMHDINNNSLVLEINYMNLSFLMTADIEKEAENKLISKIKNYSYDVLKVAHHASSTSSTKEFLQSIKVGIGIAENGYNNTFGFPSAQTINTFQELKIPLYNTKEHGTIKLTQKLNNKVKITCCY